MSGRLLYRFLVRLYPARFRQRFGSDMLAEFDLRRRQKDTWAGLFTLWAGILLDWLKTLPRAHWDEWTGPFAPHPSKKRDGKVPEDLMKDIRIAVRGLIRRPGPAMIAVLALALGIGLTAGMFSIVNGVILKGLPLEDSHELMSISRINPSQGQSRLISRIHDFTDLRERQTTFDDLAAYQVTAFNLSSGDGPPEFVNGANVTPNTLDVLQARPIVGRGFSPDDGMVGATPVATIAHRFWQDRFGGAPSVIGSVVRLDGRPTEIIGVMPEGFEFPFSQQLWTPLPPADLSQARGSGPSILVFGRLSDGVSEEQGQADLGRIMDQLAVEYPESNQGMTVMVGPYVRELIGYQVPSLLYTMLAAVGLVLLIACANVANLLLARATLRGKEVALKTALGASRSRVVLQLLIDSSVIAALGGVLGLGIAQIAIEGFNRSLSSLPQGIPFWFSVHLDARVLVFVVALVVGAALLSGFIPAWRASRANVNDILKDDSRGASSLRLGRLSRGLVVAEVALSVALLASAGLMIKSVTNLTNVDFPFEGENVFVAALSLPPSDYPDDEQRLQLFNRLRERLDAEPGFVSSSITTEMPAVGFGNGRFEIESEAYLGDRDYPSARIGSIDQAYFATVSARMMEGRAFGPSDDAGSMPVAIVNAKFAQTYFGTESALGRRLKLRRVAQAGVEIQERDDWYTIVGVAPDFYLEGDIFVLAPEAIYLPLAQRTASVANLMVRTRGEPLEVTPRVREIVAELDPDLPISQVSTLHETIQQGTAFFNVFGVIFSVFGAAALFLASVGLYGVLSFSVNQRTHEIGLRVALGATPRGVVRLVLAQAGLQLALGMALGFGLSVLLGRGLSFVLYQVAPVDSGVLVGVAGLLAITGIVASLVPATRAIRVDPAVAMHTE